MMEFIKKILGMGPSMDYKQLIAEGAQIIDVRSPSEYKGGHIKGSINIPLPELSAKIGQIKKDKAVITCCASGMRSGSAKSMLQDKGYTVYNGGGWASLRQKLS